MSSPGLQPLQQQDLTFRASGVEASAIRFQGLRVEKRLA